jgi:serine protease Do
VDVSPRSPADTAGLRKGDIVVMADDRPVRNAAQLRNRIGLARIGEQIKLTIERSGAPQVVNVAVAPSPPASGAAGASVAGPGTQSPR